MTILKFGRNWLPPGLLLVAVLLLFSYSAHAAPRNSPKTAPKKMVIANLASQFLGPHNAARSMLKLRPLVWDNNLERYAQFYAERRRFDCALKHSNGPYGENIFWGSGSGWTPGQTVQDWVNERNCYDYRSNSCKRGRECGHYTQAVWRSTSRLGCARVDCYGGRGVFMTCNYDPPGNFVGERPF